MIIVKLFHYELAGLPFLRLWGTSGLEIMIFQLAGHDV